MKTLRVIAADSGAATLTDSFEPLQVVAAASVLVERPYREPNDCLVEPIFVDVEMGSLLVVHELELCQRLLRDVKADVIHLDMSLNGVKVEDLSAMQLTQLGVSSRARGQILKILPQIRRIASDIKRMHGLDVLALGKESVPVRIAELTSGAHAILYCAKKVTIEESVLRLGLPAECSPKIAEGRVDLNSLAPAEQDVHGYAEDEKGILEAVQISEMLNPRARGFRALEIKPRK